MNVARCLSCGSFLNSCGKEPYRLECAKCGKQYFLVLQLVPVEGSQEFKLGLPMVTDLVTTKV